MTTLLQAVLFRKYDFVVQLLKHLTPKSTSLGISKMWSITFWFTFKLDGYISKGIEFLA